MAHHASSFSKSGVIDAGISTIDCDYIRPRFAASYLLADSERAMFIENNTAHSVPRLLAELGRRGLRPEQVEYVAITHVHLDHAGGSQALMAACPHATLLAHPRAVQYVVDPSRLVASARRVYGKERFRELYGEIGPVDSRRVRAMADGEELLLGARKLRFFHTRGHANHHFCIHDEASQGVFTGDSFGLAYPDLQRGGPFIFPSTSPKDFIPSEARLSVRRILDTGARRAWLTHFGEVAWLEEAACQLVAHLDFSETVLDEAAALEGEGTSPEVLDARREEHCKRRLEQHFREALRRVGLAGSGEAWELIRLDLELNAQGIAVAARKRVEERSK